MKIGIEGIEVQAVVGTQDHERTNHQKIIIDIEFEYDAARAVSTDDLRFAPDYSEMVRSVIRTAKENRFHLIETLSDKVLDIIKGYDSVTSAKVTVKKPSALKNIVFVSAQSNF